MVEKQDGVANAAHESSSTPEIDEQDLSKSDTNDAGSSSGSRPPTPPEEDESDHDAESGNVVLDVKIPFDSTGYRFATNEEHGMRIYNDEKTKYLPSNVLAPGVLAKFIEQEFPGTCKINVLFFITDITYCEGQPDYLAMCLRMLVGVARQYCFAIKVERDDEWRSNGAEELNARKKDSIVADFRELAKGRVPLRISQQWKGRSRHHPG